MYAILTIIASLSPLLTLCYLWQVKEWRFDRLREHVREDGVFSLWGKLRPSLVLISIVAAMLDSRLWPLLPLALLAILSIVQIIRKRQPSPVWTSKAKTVFLGGMLLNIIVAILLTTHYALLTPLAPLLQPLLLALTLFVLTPLDTYLKNRIFKKARQIRETHPELTVIGITGSVGKTTTKELLGHVLQDLDPLVTPARVNTEMGVSQWLINKLEQEKSEIRNPKSEIAIIEMGAYRQGEIANLCSIVKPTISALTFIGTQHIALFGSQEKLSNAKGEIITALSSDGLAVTNGDNEFCREHAANAPCKAITVGTGGHADLEGFDIEETSDGIRFRVGDTLFTLPLHGTHNVTNVLITIAIARHLGLSDSDIAAKLRTFTPPHNTFTIREERGVTILDDTHNSSPASTKACMAWARSQPHDQKTLLMAGLQELGGTYEKVHKELGAYAADIFDRIIVLHPKAAKCLEEGCGKPVENSVQLDDSVRSQSLLVCTGRMSKSTIEKLLP